MRADTVDVRGVETVTPVKAEGATNAWAAPMVAAARTNFIVLCLLVKRLGRRVGSRGAANSNWSGCPRRLESYEQTWVRVRSQICPLQRQRFPQKVDYWKTLFRNGFRTMPTSDASLRTLKTDLLYVEVGMVVSWVIPTPNQCELKATKLPIDLVIPSVRRCRQQIIRAGTTGDGGHVSLDDHDSEREPLLLLARGRFLQRMVLSTTSIFACSLTLGLNPSVVHSLDAQRDVRTARPPPAALLLPVEKIRVS